MKKANAKKSDSLSRFVFIVLSMKTLIIFYNWEGANLKNKLLFDSCDIESSRFCNQFTGIIEAIIIIFIKNLRIVFFNYISFSIFNYIRTSICKYYYWILFFNFENRLNNILIILFTDWFSYKRFSMITKFNYSFLIIFFLWGKNPNQDFITYPSYITFMFKFYIFNFTFLRRTRKNKK